MFTASTTFSKGLIETSADIRTLGCTLCDILGELPLFEGFMPDKDDIIAEMVNLFHSSSDGIRGQRAAKFFSKMARGSQI